MAYPQPSRPVPYSWTVPPPARSSSPPPPRHLPIWTEGSSIGLSTVVESAKAMGVPLFTAIRNILSTGQRRQLWIYFGAYRIGVFTKSGAISHWIDISSQAGQRLIAERWVVSSWSEALPPNAQVTVFDFVMPDGLWSD